MTKRLVVLTTLLIVSGSDVSYAQYCDCGPKKSAPQLEFENLQRAQPDSTVRPYAMQRVKRADGQDSLLNGAIIGGVLGSAAGIYVFRDWSEFAGNNPGAKETITGILIGGALGASIGMLIDALF